MKLAGYEECTGCGACASVCPKNCINMGISPNDGFFHPNINTNLCINCGLCQKSCHPLYPHKTKTDQSVFYAAAAIDEELRKEGSSGAFFGCLANYVIKNSGIVYGAAFFDNCHSLKHASSETVNLQKLKKSKYLESNMDHVIADIKQQLKNERLVLFCGTPCQAMGVRQVFHYKHSNLIIVDFLCHGVPSQKAYNNYIIELEERYNSKVVDVAFRSKRFGWKAYCIVVKFENGKEYIKTANEDPYFTRFFNNQGLRNSCYSCNRAIESEADFTIGDYWNVRKSHIGDDDKGVSLVAVRSKLAGVIFHSLNDLVSFKLSKADVEYAFTHRSIIPPEIERSDSFFSKEFHPSLKVLLQSFLIKHRITRNLLYKIIYR